LLLECVSYMGHGRKASWRDNFKEQVGLISVKCYMYAPLDSHAWLASSYCWTANWNQNLDQINKKKRRTAFDNLEQTLVSFWSSFFSEFDPNREKVFLYLECLVFITLILTSQNKNTSQKYKVLQIFLVFV
jgi:hypothetical protein